MLTGLSLQACAAAQTVAGNGSRLHEVPGFQAFGRRSLFLQWHAQPSPSCPEPPSLSAEVAAMLNAR